MTASTPLSLLPLVCPLDGEPLAEAGRSLTCPKGHSFDLAASGYANLLPTHLKASRDPGDSKAMVAARRRVLDAGCFDPLAEAASQIARDHADQVPDQPFLFVDAGCGEGFYTGHIALKLRERRPEALSLGVDISKWAVIAAAGRRKDIGWTVGSNKRLPVAQGSASLIACLFGFPMWPEWAALQQPGQLVLMVDPGPRHLLELRELIYPSIRMREPPSYEAALESGYDLIASVPLTYARNIEDAQLLDDILEMTPHGHKITADARASVRAVLRLNLTFDTLIRVYRRN